MIKSITWLISNRLTNDSTSCNKELNGGYGAWDKIVEDIISHVIAKSKENHTISLRFIV